MSPKNQTKVIIGGNIYTLSGEESEEYIQRVALYINNKMKEVSFSENGKELNTRLLSVLLAINIADELFKTRSKVEELERGLKEKDNIISELEQDMVSMQVDMENYINDKAVMVDKINTLEKEIEKLKEEIKEYSNVFEDND